MLRKEEVANRRTCRGLSYDNEKSQKERKMCQKKSKIIVCNYLIYLNLFEYTITRFTTIYGIERTYAQNDKIRPNN